MFAFFLPLPLRCYTYSPRTSPILSSICRTTGYSAQPRHAPPRRLRGSTTCAMHDVLRGGRSICRWGVAWRGGGRTHAHIGVKCAAMTGQVGHSSLTRAHSSTLNQGVVHLSV